MFSSCFFPAVSSRLFAANPSSRFFLFPLSQGLVIWAERCFVLWPCFAAFGLILPLSFRSCFPWGVITLLLWFHGLGVFSCRLRAETCLSLMAGVLKFIPILALHWGLCLELLEKLLISPEVLRLKLSAKKATVFLHLMAHYSSARRCSNNAKSCASLGPKQAW